MTRINFSLVHVLILFNFSVNGGRESLGARGEIFPKEKEMGKVDKIKKKKPPEDGKRGGKREEHPSKERGERRCQRRASPQVLAAGGALEPIRPTSVHKSGCTHNPPLSSFSLSLFFLSSFFISHFFRFNSSCTVSKKSFLLCVKKEISTRYISNCDLRFLQDLINKNKVDNRETGEFLSLSFFFLFEIILDLPVVHNVF